MNELIASWHLRSEESRSAVIKELRDIADSWTGHNQEDDPETFEDSETLNLIVEIMEYINARK